MGKKEFVVTDMWTFEPDAGKVKYKMAVTFDVYIPRRLFKVVVKELLGDIRKLYEKREMLLLDLYDRIEAAKRGY